MKQLLIFCWIVGLAGLVFGAQTYIPDSDLELGFTNPNNVLIMRQEKAVVPVPGVKPPEVNVVMGNPYIWMTLVTAKEHGQHPDARITVLSGGPGYNEVVLRIIPGPSGGYNYTFESWGVRFGKKPYKGFIELD